MTFWPVTWFEPGRPGALRRHGAWLDRAVCAFCAVCILALPGCMATGDSFEGLNARYVNAVADTAALGTPTPQLLSEHADIARSAAAAAPGPDVSAGERAGLFALAVKSAWASGDAGLLEQAGGWARTGSMVCDAPVNGEANSDGGGDGGASGASTQTGGTPGLGSALATDCAVLAVMRILATGDGAVGELQHIAAAGGRQWSVPQLVQAARAAETFAGRAVGNWATVNSHVTDDDANLPVGFGDWARSRQREQWCAFEAVAGFEALQGIAAGSREGFQARNRMRDAYLDARSGAQRTGAHHLAIPSSAGGAGCGARHE